MIRLSRLAAPLLIGALALGLPGLGYAQSSSQELGAQWVQALQNAADAQKNGDTQAYNRYMNQASTLQQAMEAAKQVESSGANGAAGNLDTIGKLEEERIKAEIDRIKAQSERDREMYDRPGFWEKFGDKAVDIMGSMISQLLQQWIAGGGQDEDLLNRIKELQAERDRLTNERENPGPGAGDSGLGRIITDSTGAHGYDRDGDGFVDIPVNPDGSLGEYDPSDPNGYSDDFGGPNAGSGGGMGGMLAGAGTVGDVDGDGDVDAEDVALARERERERENDPNYPYGAGGGSGGGGASFGGSGGPNFGGGAGDGAAAANAEGAGFPGAEGAEGGEAGKIGKEGEVAGGTPTSPDGEGVDDKELQTVIGRVLILPKLEAEKLAGERKEGGDAWAEDEWAKDDWNEWGDDGWDDSKDNGDLGAEKKDGEADKGKVGSGKQAKELVDQLIRVETEIAEWRKKEKAEDGADATSSDPYAFEDSMGFEKEGGEKKDDPFKNVRDKDGKIDLAKVDVWVIARDSWKKGKDPVRYRVKLSDQLTDFEPIHGGYVVARGALKDVESKDQRVKNVLEEIKGELKELELVQVILSAEKPPEDMDALDPARTTDEGVGGLKEGTLKEEEWGSDWNDGGW